MTVHKTHIRDIRLFNNAGVRVACCSNIDSRRATPFAEKPNDATCQTCRRVYQTRYPWTRLK